MPRPKRGVGQGTFSMPPGGGSRSGFGSTPCFSGSSTMSQRPSSGSRKEFPAPFPMSSSTWQAIDKQLALSPQQTRIVELILHGLQDKEIAARLSITFSTLRSHLERIYRRLQVSSSKEVILLIFKMAQGLKTCSKCGQ